MSYYNHTLAEVEVALRTRFPRAHANSNGLEKGLVQSYLLWMIEKIREMDTTSIEEAIKAARWIGRVLAHTELLLNWDNMKSRDLIRHDVRELKSHLPKMAPIPPENSALRPFHPPRLAPDLSQKDRNKPYDELKGV